MINQKTLEVLSIEGHQSSLVTRGHLDSPRKKNHFKSELEISGWIITGGGCDYKLVIEDEENKLIEIFPTLARKDVADKHSEFLDIDKGNFFAA